MKMTTRRLLLAVLLFVFLASLSCVGTPSTLTPCQCGSPEHDLLGCTSQCCIDVNHDCGNLDCTCIDHESQALDHRRY